MDTIAYVATIKEVIPSPLNAPAPSGGLSQYVPYGSAPSEPKWNVAVNDDATPYYCKTQPLHIRTLPSYLP